MRKPLQMKVVYRKRILLRLLATFATNPLLHTTLVSSMVIVEAS